MALLRRGPARPAYMYQLFCPDRCPSPGRTNFSGAAKGPPTTGYHAIPRPVPCRSDPAPCRSDPAPPTPTFPSPLRLQAIEHYEKHLESHPGDDIAAFWLAVLRNDAAAAPACPAAMVADLFDQYADKFDEHLVNQLGYKTPGLLLTVLQRHAPGGDRSKLKFDRAMDLGCGTGECRF